MKSVDTYTCFCLSRVDDIQIAKILRDLLIEKLFTSASFLVNVKSLHLKLIERALAKIKD